MSERRSTGLPNKNLFTFVCCLLCALFFWTTVKLSKINRKELPVRVQIVNIPQEMSFENDSVQYINVIAKGSAYSLLKNYISNPKVEVSYDILQPIGGNRYRIPRNKIALSERKHTGLEIESSQADTIYLNLQPNLSKKLPVQVELNTHFAREYRLSELTITPDSVVVTGLQSEIDTMNAVYVQLPMQQYVNQSFTENIKLSSSSRIRYDADQINVNATVDKFSERIIKVSVKTINIPQGHQVKLYPEEVEILCAGSFDLIKGLSADDILVEADYVEREELGVLPLHIRTTIRGVKLTFYKNDETDYLIRKIK